MSAWSAGVSPRGRPTRTPRRLASRRVPTARRRRNRETRRPIWRREGSEHVVRRRCRARARTDPSPRWRLIRSVCAPSSWSPRTPCPSRTRASYRCTATPERTVGAAGDERLVRAVRLHRGHRAVVRAGLAAPPRRRVRAVGLVRHVPDGFRAAAKVELPPGFSRPAILARRSSSVSFARRRNAPLCAPLCRLYLCTSPPAVPTTAKVPHALIATHSTAFFWRRRRRRLPTRAVARGRVRPTRRRRAATYARGSPS